MANYWYPNIQGGGGGGGILTINSDNTSAQTFSVGTTGTDFNIVNSGGGAHVLELPVSSNVNTGKLSNTDWSTFNAKQNALTIGNLSDVGTDGITVTSGTGAVIGSGTSLSQHVSDSTHNGYLSSTDWSTFNNKLASADLVSTTLATASGATAATTDNSLGVSFDIPVSGADSDPHAWDFSIDGTSFVSLTSVGDGAGGIISRAITLNQPVESTQPITIDNLPRPSAFSTALSSPADPGNLDNGSYRYSVTFTNQYGETTGSTASLAVVVVDKTVNGKIHITGIPIAPNSEFSDRGLYRQFNGTGSYLLVTYLGDNTTTDYLDNIPNSGLGLETVPQTNTTAALVIGTLYQFGGPQPYAPGMVFRPIEDGFSAGMEVRPVSPLTNTYTGNLFNFYSLQSGTTALKTIIDQFGRIAIGATTASACLDIATALGGSTDFLRVRGQATLDTNVVIGGYAIASSATITAANDLVLGGKNFNIVSGNTQINAITLPTGFTAGTEITLLFSGTPLIKNSTAGGAGTKVMFLSGSQDLQAAANTVLTLIYDGTQFQQKALKAA